MQGERAGGHVVAGFGLGIARPLFAIAIGAQLGACALVPQPRDEVWVRIGSGPLQSHRAEPYASLYLPYAMMSSLAYTRREKLNADLCPDPALLAKDSQATEWIKALHARKWRCVFGLSDRQACPRRYPDCRRIDVPDLQVWRRSDPFCSEIVVAYRGINLLDPSDWPNLRWAVKFPSRFDEYEQMQWQIDGIVGKSGCRAAGRIIAVGHSLGGGYAEEAAYANGKSVMSTHSIRFRSSGWWIPIRSRACTTKKAWASITCTRPARFSPFRAC
jgi:hypothetical protein